MMAKGIVSVAYECVACENIRLRGVLALRRWGRFARKKVVSLRNVPAAKSEDSSETDVFAG